MSNQIGTCPFFTSAVYIQGSMLACSEVGLFCRTRVLYSPEEGREPLRAEYNDACSIRPAWADLVDKAGLVDFDLSDTKVAFSATTRQQV